MWLRLLALAAALPVVAHAQTVLTRPPTAAQTGVAMPGSAANYLSAGVKPDLAFGAFQRGYFVTALREAMKRVEADPADGPAMTMIGELYRDGLGVRTDPREAARWYKLAADRGDAQGAFALGLAHLQARGVPEDRALARGMFQKAAAKDHTGALYNLGLMATEDRPPDFTAAAGFFQRAADLGNADAVYALAIAHREGRGVDKDPAKAVALLRKAASEHIVAAQLDLAFAYFNGEGVTKDETLAGTLFRRAASKNNPIAANRLARILVVGRGLPRDMVEAMKWHILARTAGIKDEWLDSQLATLSPRDRMAVEDAVRKHVGQ